MLVELATNFFNSFLVWFLRLRLNSMLFLNSQTVAIAQNSIITSFKFFVLLKVCTVAIKIVNDQILKLNWTHDINSFRTKNARNVAYKLH